ncbi:hypothetical protein [Peribacillus simplex]|uniref:hypothetical protein n=1 Tax=Peribacillus simplex TaxID=1478 RepID=UPI0024C11E18|nr:hypothetical protein [Peribacillus simplex]WHY99274.1 hypothetical protein QNH37_08995 [Peribacillus simplex]
MKKKKIISSFIASVSILGISSVIMFNSSDVTKANNTTNQTDAFTILKQDHKELKNVSSQPFIVVNNKKHTKEEFKKFEEISNFIQVNNGDPVLSESELQEDFIADAVLVDHAETENIVVTKSEAEEFSKTMRKIVEESSDDATKQFINDYISATGITEEEYWNQTVEGYKKTLTIGKLKEKFFKDLESNKSLESNTNKLATSNVTSENSNELNEAWDKYQQELVNKANVELLNQ